MAIAWVAGHDIDACVPPPLSTGTTRFNDLRHVVFDRLPRPGVTVELRRLLAFLCDLPLRSVIDWDQRRRLRRRVLTSLALALGLGAAVYFVHDAHLERLARSNLTLAVQSGTAGLAQREIAGHRHPHRPAREGSAREPVPFAVTGGGGGAAARSG